MLVSTQYSLIEKGITQDVWEQFNLYLNKVDESNVFINRILNILNISNMINIKHLKHFKHFKHCIHSNYFKHFKYLKHI